MLLALQVVEWAFHADALIHHVQVNHRRFDALVAQQFLQSSDIISDFQQMCGETMAEAVRGRPFTDARGPDGCRKFAADRTLVSVVSAEKTCSWLGGELRGREHVLPVPLGRCFGRFPIEGEGQIDATIPGSEVGIVERLHADEVGVQVGNQRFGEHRDAVLAAFAVADHRLTTIEIEVFDPKREGFEQPQASTILEPGNLAVGTL